MAMSAGTRTLQTRRDSDTGARARASRGRPPSGEHTGRLAPQGRGVGPRRAQPGPDARDGFQRGVCGRLETVRFPPPELSVTPPDFHERF